MPKEARKEKKKRKRDRENLKDQDRPHAADVPEDSQVETASDHERRKGSEKPGATSAAPMTTVAPSPFAPKGLSSVGVTFHKGSCKFQVGRKWGKTMFYGKPKVRFPVLRNLLLFTSSWLNFNLLPCNRSTFSLVARRRPLLLIDRSLPRTTSQPPLSTIDGF